LRKKENVNNTMSNENELKMKDMGVSKDGTSDSQNPLNMNI
jgi:hypothetical protein